MVKDNLSRKLVSRCVAGALALIITMMGVSDMSNSSDPAVAAQAETVTTAEAETTQAADETVAYSMATFKASQGASAGSMVSKAETTAATSIKIRKPTAATTTKKTAEKKAETTTTTTKTTTAAPKAVVTTAFTPAATAAPVTTTAPQTTTVTTTAPAQQADPNAELKTPVIQPEQTYDTDYTHPWNAQTNSITIHWNAVAGAKKYMVFVYGGQFTKWTEVATTGNVQYTVTGLKRDTAYTFSVKAVSEDGKHSDISAPVSIKTARMDYSAAGWQAMCRIVYHEVGGAAGSFWDKPIVYVADCVTNQYVCAKYTYQGTWSKYYARYSNIESIIYTSGGFASSATLSARGANYCNVSQRVKLAVWGATYGVTYYNNIANDYNIFYWSSSGYAVSSSKLGYSFKTPFGNYVNIWRQYWG